MEGNASATGQAVQSPDEITLSMRNPLQERIELRELFQSAIVNRLVREDGKVTFDDHIDEEVKAAGDGFGYRGDGFGREATEGGNGGAAVSGWGSEAPAAKEGFTASGGNGAVASLATCNRTCRSTEAYGGELATTPSTTVRQQH